MIQIKLNGASALFPESYDELTFGQSLKLLDMPTKAESIRRILNIKPGQILEGMEVLYRAAGFLDKPVLLDETPTQIGDYKLPQDITVKSAEQFEDISFAMKTALESKDIVKQTEALALYAAIYIQPYFYANAYDGEQAQLLAKRFHDYPCREVMSAGSFFQARYLSSESGLPMNSLRSKLLMKKKRRGLIGFLKSLVSTGR